MRWFLTDSDVFSPQKFSMNPASIEVSADLDTDSQGRGAPSSESAQAKGAPPAGNAQAEQGSGDSGRPDRWGRILSEQATSASDDSGELIEPLRDLESGEGGLGRDRALLAAEAVGALFSAPGGMSVRENAALVIRELARAGVDVGKMLAAIAEVSARDRAEVAAGELRDGLKDVLALVHRMAAATTSRVGGHLSGFDERAQGVITSALMAQAVLDRVEAGSRRLIARVDEVQRMAEQMASGVAATKDEPENIAPHVRQDRFRPGRGAAGRLATSWHTYLRRRIGGSGCSRMTSSIARTTPRC